MNTRALILSLTFLAASGLPALASNTIQFKGRTIDLDAFLTGFPYTTPFVDVRTGHLFYKKKGKTDQLMMLSYDPMGREKVDLEKGKIISPKDFSKRNLWGVFYSPLTKKVVIEADENNDEVINLYELDPATGKERRLTHTAYIFGFTLSEDAKRVALVTRSGKDEMSSGDVRVLDLTTGEEKVVYHDSPENKLMWGAPSWQPGDKGLLVTMIASGDRSHRNVLYVPLDGGEARVLTDRTVKRSELSPLNHWFSETDYLYTSNEADFTGVYKASLNGGAPVLVTKKGENVKDAAVLRKDGASTLAVVIGDPIQSELKLIDPASGEAWFDKTYPELLSLYDEYEDRAAIGVSSLSIPFKIEELRVSGRTAELFDRAAYPDKLLKKVVRCDVEKTGFETFDKLTTPGDHPGLMHAYLLKPKVPRTGPDARALVLSFYGGENQFSTAFEILCDAGYYVLSPAPRGTTDFGAAYYDKAEGDWGGGETLDDLSAGKFLAERLRLPAAHIGIFGGSRGGYDTLRALTFPGEVNGVKESFRFGFGISDFGVGDIIRAGKGGNISQWYAYLTGGDPMKDEKKWIDRSPETHADLLSGPVLLTHGTNDHRIPVTESRLMYAKLKSLGKEAYFTEMPGQGHGYKGMDSLTRYYRAVFDFLAKVD